MPGVAHLRSHLRWTLNRESCDWCDDDTGSFDSILDTVAAPRDLDPVTARLKRDATLCLVGARAQPHPSPAVFNLLFERRRIPGSLVGGTLETHEMLDFAPNTASHRTSS